MFQKFMDHKVYVLFYKQKKLTINGKFLQMLGEIEQV